jgi:hypothetical protein
MVGSALFVVTGLLIGSDRDSFLAGVRRENWFHYLLGAFVHAGWCEGDVLLLLLLLLILCFLLFSAAAAAAAAAAAGAALAADVAVACLVCLLRYIRPSAGAVAALMD